MTRIGLFFSVPLLTGLLGCAATPRAEDVSQAEWTAARTQLDAMRLSAPRGAYVEQIRLVMREPWTGKVFLARGAVAVQPNQALRMVLIGPGGQTAVDAWITKERWRFAVPAIEFRRAGGADPDGSQHLDEARGLPIGFLRWWYLAPLGGRLLSARAGERESRFILRDGSATVVLRTAIGTRGTQRLSAVRREGGSVERLLWVGRGPRPHAGDRALYVQDEHGLQIEVVVEGISAGEPDPAAFLDPDEKGTPL